MMRKICKVYFYGAIALSFLLPKAVDAQAPNYRWQTTIHGVQQTGFYYLPLTPDIVGKSVKAHLEDIRLYQDKQEIPYIIRERKPQLAPSFDSLAILSYTQDATKHSILTVDNPKRQQLSHLLIAMNNASTDKEIQLRGSYDQQKWYVVKETFALNTAIVSSSGTEMVARLRFPATSYPFYSLLISDSSSAPLYIKKVGVDTLKTKQTSPYLDKVPQPKIQEISSATPATSLWQVSFDSDYLLQQVSFEVSSPALYRREMRILLKQQVKDKRGRAVERYEEVGRGVLTPENLLITLDHEVKARALYVSIRNGDNTPLLFKSIVAWQRQYDLIAYLEEGNRYQLVLGNEGASLPNYDLGYFESSIKKELPVLGIDAFQDAGPPVEKESFTLFKSAYWLWAGLALLIAFLLWMSGKLLREMKGKK